MEGPHHIGLDMEHPELLQPCSPTFHTSDLNVNRARLIYGLVTQMDMDLGLMISRQITQIA